MLYIPTNFFIYKMCAFFTNNRMRVEAIGRKVTIPDNDYAKLMYYLSCVGTVINYDKMDELGDYNRYYLLNAEQKEIILKACEALNPKIFISAGVFIVDEKLLPDNNCNQFYQITDQRIGIHINQHIMIGGRTVKVLKIMACNLNWLNKYYITPIKNIHSVKNLAFCFAKALASASRDEDENEEECIIW